MDNLLKYIKQQDWFFGIRREEALFFYSAKYKQRAELTSKYYKSPFVESILFPRKENELIRLFNLEQAKIFHQESKDKICQSPNILFRLVRTQQSLWRRIAEKEKQLKIITKKGDRKKAVSLFNKLLDLYGQGGADFFAFFSFGMMLQECGQKEKNVQLALRAHNQWRNSITFKEEELGKTFYNFFDFWLRSIKIKIKPKLIIYYLTASEISNLLTGGIKEVRLNELIKFRRKHNFIYLYLRNSQYRDVVLDEPGVVEPIVNYLTKLDREKNKSGQMIRGHTVINKGIIRGQAVIVKNREILERKKPDLTNKILVTVQTTPHFIARLKGVRGIITDEGGITCHAAIISRELKIPCVVGTGKATRLIKNGDAVQIDTAKGIIKIINIKQK